MSPVPAAIELAVGALATAGGIGFLCVTSLHAWRRRPTKWSYGALNDPLTIWAGSLLLCAGAIGGGIIVIVDAAARL